ncbi:MAG: LacI family DNA-binding transcriptional regulator [Oscillospiraceae bacterium]
MAAGIRDVAKLAGVAVGTVSRAFNGYSDIKPETQKRIFEAAKELGYRPNASAQNLSSKKKLNFGIILSGILSGNSAYHGEYVFRLLHGAYRYATETNMEISMFTVDPHVQEKRGYEQFCAEKSLSGAVIFNLKSKDPYFSQLSKGVSVPCVTVDILSRGGNVGSVAVDEVRAFQDMTQYLIDKGHKDLVFLAGERNSTATLGRLAGAYDAFLANGISFRQENVFYCNFSESEAYQVARKYVETHDKSDATAFISMSDAMAAGAMRAVKDCGYSVPGDFSVTGYDFINLSQYTDPRITTIDQRIEEKGYTAVKLLREIIANERDARCVYIPYYLVLGDSVRQLEV